MSKGMEIVLAWMTTLDHETAMHVSDGQGCSDEMRRLAEAIDKAIADAKA